MKAGVIWKVAASAMAIAISVQLAAQTRGARRQTAKATWSERTPWGDPDLQGEWTTEGEYGVPLERPAQFGTRQFLSDAEYAKRLDDVKIRDERDLARVDVLSGKVEGANAPIPHWREYNTTSRRTSLVIDPPDGRLPPRTRPGHDRFPYSGAAACSAASRATPARTTASASAASCTAAAFPMRCSPPSTTPTCGSCRARAWWPSPTSSFTTPASFRSMPHLARLSENIRMYMGDARGHWEGTTLVVETTNLKANTRGSSPGLRLIERFTRTGRDSIDYQVTFVDPTTWTAPWTAALDMKGRPDDAGVFEYACHEGNYGLEHMLRTSRLYDR